MKGTEKCYFSRIENPEKWEPEVLTVKFPFNLERFVRWCHRYGLLKWIYVRPVVSGKGGDAS